MKDKLIKLKFLRLISEIEEYDDRIENLELDKYGLDSSELKKDNNLPIIVEIGKIIYSKLLDTGVWDTSGYKHHVHAKDVKECLDVLEPLSRKMLKRKKNKTFEEIMDSISEGEDFIMEGIDSKKYSEIIQNFPVAGTCYKWIHNTENILRKFIIKILDDNGLPSDASIFGSDLNQKLESRKRKEAQKTYIPIRGGHDIYYMDFKDLNRYFTKYWTIVFYNIFESQSWITDKIKELYDIRNLVAHNSFNLNKDTSDLVKVYCKQIIKLIDPYV